MATIMISIPDLGKYERSLRGLLSCGGNARQRRRAIRLIRQVIEEDFARAPKPILL
jgi:hypothetical protein